MTNEKLFLICIILIIVYNLLYHFIMFTQFTFYNIIFQDGSIEFEEFIKALSVTSRGNLDEKLHCKYLVFNFSLPFPPKLLSYNHTLYNILFYILYNLTVKVLSQISVARESIKNDGNN